MGFFDICCSCCSGDTVLPDSVPRTHIKRAVPEEKQEELKPLVESIDVISVEPAEELGDVNEETSEVTIGAPISAVKKRPLKECKLKPARHRITLTGAAAAVPPCSVAECVGDVPKVSSSKVTVGEGAYLVYSLEQNGSLSMNFTKKAIDSLDGVLAYIKPATEFSSYHYSGGGCKVVATNLQTCMQSQYANDRKPFYKAWCQFLKLTIAGNGVAYLLEASGLSPPPLVRILIFKDGNIQTAEKLTPIDLRECGAIGVLPPAFDYESVGDISDRTKYNAPPKGSRIARELEKFATDPLNTSPWEYEQPLVQSFTKEQNASYSFLKNNWGYLDHSTDPHQPAGVLEGGRENYTGKGLRLVGGRDRQRTEPMPYYLDHGVKWRQRTQMGAVSFAISPDANQDVRVDETDLDLEARQWGSWSRPMYTDLPAMESAIRSHSRAENPTDLPYHWILSDEIIEHTPVHVASGASFIPDPDPDMYLAATGHFGGYMRRPFEFPRETIKRQNLLLTEWDRLEAQYAKNPDEDIAERIHAVKNALCGYDRMINNDNTSFKVAIDAAITLMRDLTKEQRDDPAHNPDVIDYYLRKVPDPTAVGGGCSHYSGPGRTSLLCLIGYYPDTKAFAQYTSVEELAEGYHRLMTEMRFEGRSHTVSQMVLDDEVQDYVLRGDRRKFPRLIAEYAPIWAYRKFGAEFGDALKRGHTIPENDLTTFGRRLRKRPRGYTEEERARNFVDDYSNFCEECG
ncbi:uncharacterized protein BXIN_2135 [Babesia sp. Xinjiang]|uniref:uncharacterized protein n=1 Tax=Babesia sp. Xinjiang TaxID=462227 RepID=UPI000A241FC9|nr:uncharacterized protein BXIN_2135 [Babesia sp. Xinjiang]ORM40528.1 hypothetical protein BXIN_2135 [Babesia sp. Xinjiang]